jgi:nicotinamidase-related amidase
MAALSELTHTHPRAAAAALITIDVQNDFVLPGAPAEIAGTYERLAAIRMLAEAFRRAGRPIVHVVRLYKPDGSNVDACRREFIEKGARIAAPGSAGADLVNALKPRADVKLDADLLLAGRFQPVGECEWLMYKPRWDAFYQTGLEVHLQQLGVDTVVFCGCNFPNCPRASIYGASNRDLRLIVVDDAVSGIYAKGVAELRNIQVSLMNTAECVKWLREGTA